LVIIGLPPFPKPIVPENPAPVNKSTPSLSPEEQKQFLEYYNQAEMFLAQREYARALSFYNLALEINPTDEDTKTNISLTLAKIALQEKQPEEKPTLPIRRTLPRRIAANLKQKEIVPAKPPEQQPPKDSANTYYQQGLQSLYAGDYIQAILFYTSAIGLAPNNPDFYQGRGLAYRLNKNYEGAIADYTKALEIKAGDVSIYQVRGVTYGEMGKYDQAIADYNRALAINPNDAETYNLRGVAYSNRGSCDQAIADYTRATVINPHLGIAYINRSIAYAEKGNYAKAWEDVRKAESLSTKVPGELMELLRKKSPQ